MVLVIPALKEAEAIPLQADSPASPQKIE